MGQACFEHEQELYIGAGDAHDLQEEKPGMHTAGVAGQAAKVWRRRCRQRASKPHCWINAGLLQLQPIIRRSCIATTSKYVGWWAVDPNLASPAHYPSKISWFCPGGRHMPSWTAHEGYPGQDRGATAPEDMSHWSTKLMSLGMGTRVQSFFQGMARRLPLI